MDEKRREEMAAEALKKEMDLARAVFHPEASKAAQEAGNAEPGGVCGREWPETHSRIANSTWRCDLPAGHKGLCEGTLPMLEISEVEAREVAPARSGESESLTEFRRAEASTVEARAPAAPADPGPFDGSRSSILLCMISDAIDGRCMACSWPILPRSFCMQGDCRFVPDEHTPEYLQWKARMQIIALARKLRAAPATK